MDRVVSIEGVGAQALDIPIPQLKHTPHGTPIGCSDISPRGNRQAAISAAASVNAKAFSLCGGIEKDDMIQIRDGRNRCGVAGSPICRERGSQYLVERFRAIDRYCAHRIA